MKHPGGAIAAVRDAISRAWREHIQSAIRKDLDGVVDIYADDIVYVVADSPEVRGRAAMTTEGSSPIAAATGRAALPDLRAAASPGLRKALGPQLTESGEEIRGIRSTRTGIY